MVYINDNNCCIQNANVWVLIICESYNTTREILVCMVYASKPHCKKIWIEDLCECTKKLILISQ